MTRAEIERALAAARRVQQAYDAPNLRAGNAQALVTWDAEARVLRVSVAGSNDWDDWRQNVWLCRRRQVNDKGSVHAGFWQHANLIAPPLRARLTDLGFVADDARIHVEGHSAGAAVAVCLLIQFWTFRLSSATVHLFGCPRVVTRGLARYLGKITNAEVLNIQAKGDPVCRMPPALMGWAHVGDVVEIGESDAHPDHLMRYYLRDLEAAVRGAWRGETA